jgi:ribosome-associated toxin RatA of RatAB toxin-antitoxin module
MHELVVDENLPATARAVSTVEREMAVSAEQLFAAFEDETSWPKWVPGMRETTWTSPKPLAKGMTRTIKMVGGHRIDEVFWAWEPNRRMAFSVAAVSVGWLSGFTEVYDVTPLSSGRCRLRWTLAVRFAGRLAVIEPAYARTLPMSQKRLLRKLERVTRELATSV